jgi:hypothetical protein
VPVTRVELLSRSFRGIAIAGALLVLQCPRMEAQTTLPAVLRGVGTLSESRILGVVGETCLAADLTPEERRTLKAKGVSDQFIASLIALRCKVRFVSIFPDTLRMRPSDRINIDVITQDSSGAGVVPITISWRVADTAIATVTSNGIHGVLLARQAGTTELVIEAEGRVARKQVTVAVPTAERVAITRKVKWVAEGSGAQLTAAVSDENGVQFPDSGVQWGSRTPGILTVDNLGFVFGVRAGTATVYASIRGIPRDSVVIEVEAVQRSAAAMPLQAPAARDVVPPLPRAAPSSSPMANTAALNVAARLARTFELARDSLTALANKRGTASNVGGDAIAEIRATWPKDGPKVRFESFVSNGRGDEGVWRVTAEIPSTSFAVRASKQVYYLTVRVTAVGGQSSTLTREQP